MPAPLHLVRWLPLVGSTGCGRLFLALALKPQGHFTPPAEDTRPDYADATAWYARPDRFDPADGRPAGLDPIPVSDQPADLFFVAPPRGSRSHPGMHPSTMPVWTT